MTRAPVVRFPSVVRVVQCIAWLESAEGFHVLKQTFDRTSSYIDLLSVFPNPVSSGDGGRGGGWSVRIQFGLVRMRHLLGD